MSTIESEVINDVREIKERLQSMEKRNSIEFSRTSKGAPSWSIKVYAERIEDAVELATSTDAKLTKLFLYSDQPKQASEA